MYGIAVVPLADGFHHVYYVDAKRGVLGRLHVSSTGEGKRAHTLVQPLITMYHHNAPTELTLNNNVLLVLSIERGHEIAAGSVEDVIVLKDVQEPRGLTADLARGFLYLTLFDGSAYKVRLGQASTATSAQSTAASASAMPFWVTRVYKARTSSRFDGIAAIPMAEGAVQQSWREQ
jgi:hypothetical protein